MNSWKDILLDVSRSALESEYYEASKRLRSVPGLSKGPMGLTPDGVKQTKEYRLAKAHYEKCHATLRAFNKMFPVTVCQRKAISDNK
jgi:hypothetical protein